MPDRLAVRYMLDATETVSSSERNMKACLIVIVTFASFVGTAFGAEHVGSATVTTAAPIFFVPDLARAPQSVAKDGTVVSVRQVDGEWAEIEFVDLQHGQHVGWIQRKFIQESDDALRLTDPSVSPQSIPSSAAFGPRQVLDRRPDSPIAKRPRLDTRIKSASSKLFLGVDYEGIVIMETSATAPPSTNSGSGAGLVVGYGLTPRWALYANLSGGHVQDPDSHKIFGLGHFDVGTRVHFRTGPHVVVPFVQAGLARRAGYMTLDTSTGSHDFKGTGTGVAFGGGLNAHVTPAFAFSGGVTWSAGNFSRYTIDGVTLPGVSSHATSARMHLGLIWFPQRHVGRL
jgi:hypothetical protein